MRKGRRRQNTIILQNALDLMQCSLWLRHNVQCIGNNHHIERCIRIRQTEHVLHRKMQVFSMIFPLSLPDHLLGSICDLDVLCRICYMLRNQSGAGSQLQYGFIPHHRTQQCIHSVISRRIPAHKSVVDYRSPVPEIPAVLHFRYPPPCRLDTYLRQVWLVLANYHLTI